MSELCTCNPNSDTARAIAGMLIVNMDSSDITHPDQLAASIRLLGTLMLQALTGTDATNLPIVKEGFVGMLHDFIALVETYPLMEDMEIPPGEPN